MPKQPDTPDLNKLEAQLLAERQAYYDRIATRRGCIGGVQEDQNLDVFLQERLDRLLGTPPAR